MTIERLKNGALIILTQYESSNRTDIQCRKVLARLDSPEDFQFVTWIVDEDGNAFWGHYFDNLRDALDDYEDRG